MHRTPTRSTSNSSTQNSGGDIARQARSTCEALETRKLMSGTVLATVVNGAVTLRGDGESNAIVLDQAGLTDGQVRVSGAGATGINGQAEPVILSGVTGRVLVRMGDGADA